VRKLDGSLPSSENELLSEWRQYFDSLLNNQSAATKSANRPEPAPDIESIPTSPISRFEVLEAVKSFKNGKAPGPDFAMTAEVLKNGGRFIIDQLHLICKLVYQENRAPSQWTSSLIIPLPKKGNLQLMTNYRGISLMSIAAKVYNRVLLNRIRTPIDSILRKNQAGFRTGRSCIQQIHILRRIIDGATGGTLPLYITFIDFKKAFDSIDRDMMFAILRHYGVPEKIVKAIRVLYDNSTSRIYIDGQHSEPFNITTGVLQGDVLAPFLFIIVIDYITKRSAADFGYITHKGNSADVSGRTVRNGTRRVERKVNELAFADDLALLENNQQRAQEQLDALRREGASVGLEYNNKKIVQVIINSPADATLQPLFIDNDPVAIDSDFKYLGSYIVSTEKDIRARIALSSAAFTKLKPILTSRTGKPNNTLKIRLFNAACISILLYGCESWVLSKQQAKVLDVFVRRCYRTILGIKQSEAHMTNIQLYNEAGTRPISETIRERQLRFTGHCLRMDSAEPANAFALYPNNAATPEGREGPYVKQIASYLYSFTGMERHAAAEIAEWAKDRSQWPKLVVSAPHKPAR
jgi:hypothetical protein